MANWIKTPEGYFVWGDGEPVDPADAFGPNFDAIRNRVASLGYFNAVTDVQNAAQTIEEAQGIPPMAFLSTASETAQPNKTIGGHSQQVATRLSVLFAIMTDRAADDMKDTAEQLRKALVLILAGWTPPGAAGPLQFDRYLPRAMGDGLFWGEALFATTYRLTTR